MLARTLILVGLSALGFAMIGPLMGERLTAAAQREATTDGAAATAPAAAPSLAAVTLNRDADSHFRADMRVNGYPVRMMVDSGATTVALTESDARAVGIYPSDRDFTATAQTAGGLVRVAPVLIDRLTIGMIERRNVQAAVIRGNSLTESLLGQSFLSELGAMRVEGDRMLLN